MGIILHTKWKVTNKTTDTIKWFKGEQAKESYLNKCVSLGHKGEVETTNIYFIKGSTGLIYEREESTVKAF